MELYNSKDIKKTRKSHSCFLCRLDIPTGIECFYEAGKYDGEFFSRYSHHECAKHWLAINRDSMYGDDWLPFEEMSEVCDWNLKSWQQVIGTKYNVLDGDGL